jgi:hypothetical protein
MTIDFSSPILTAILLAIFVGLIIVNRKIKRHKKPGD